MDCRLFALQLDDWLDERLAAADREAMQSHLDACPSCKPVARGARALQAELRMLPAPGPRPGFADLALVRSAGAARRSRQTFAGMALAASLVLGLGLAAALLALRPEPLPTVVLTARQPGSVQLVFNAAKPVQRATLSVALPENVEIVGFGKQRELTWETDLREGGNLLQLPLIVHGATGGELVARVSRGASSRTFRLRILVRGADEASEMPDLSAHV